MKTLTQLKNWRGAVLAFVFVGTLAAGESSANKAEKKPGGAMVMPPATVIVAKASTIKETGMKKYVGAVQAIEDVTLYARVSGFLEKINFKEGEMVKKGDLLLKIEDDTYKANYQAMEAKLKQVDAELKYAEINYKRQQDLSREKVIARKELEEAERKINYVRAQHAEAQFNLTVAKTNLSYANITAPVSGRIGKSSFTVGNYLTLSSGALATIVQVAPIYVSFAISEPDFSNMFGNAENMKKNAVIRLRTADRKDYDETGKVTLVDNRVDPSTGTIKIWATFANKNGQLNPGGLVDVIISKVSHQELPAVKISALLISKEGQSVYVLTAENTAEARKVTAGEVIGDMQTIVSGVKAGETVIIDGIHKVRPGGQVIPFDADGKPWGQSSGNVQQKP